MNVLRAREKLSTRALQYIVYWIQYKMCFIYEWSVSMIPILSCDHFSLFNIVSNFLNFVMKVGVGDVYSGWMSSGANWGG